MFKFLHLLWANLQHRRLRVVLTIASITIAFTLFGLVKALEFALSAGVEFAGQDRLISMHKVSLVQPLPRNYLLRVEATEGVRAAASFNWLGGYYQDERNRIPSYPILNETAFFEVYPELILDEAQKKTWLVDRTGVLIGKGLAERFGWKVGDTIPLRSSIFSMKDGSNTWDVKVSGIYDFKDGMGDTTGIYMHYDYFNEARTLGRDNISWISLRVSDSNRAAEIAHNIDALFANSSVETKTSTEKAFLQSYANQLGNIGAIVTVIVDAVFFTILLVAANTMSQSVRERASQIAVMKTLGFSSLSVTLLVLGEAFLMTFIGGALGFFLANGVVKAVAKAMSQYLSMMRISSEAYVLGVIWMLVLSLLVSVLPSIQAWQLKIVNALRRA